MKLPPVGKKVLVWEGDTDPVEATARVGTYNGDGTWTIFVGPHLYYSATVIRGWMNRPRLSEGLPHTDGLLFHVPADQLNLTETNENGSNSHDAQ